MQEITLANLGEKSAQEVFNYVAKHLLTQNQKAMTDQRTCRYRTDSGLRCAAGCLIDPSEYSKDFETRSWWGLHTAALVPKSHNELIQALQQVHDGEEVCDWKAELANVAFAYSLEMPK